MPVTPLTVMDDVVRFSGVAQAAVPAVWMGVRHPMAFAVKRWVRKCFPIMILRACWHPAR